MRGVGINGDGRTAQPLGIVRQAGKEKQRVEAGRIRASLAGSVQQVAFARAAAMEHELPWAPADVVDHTGNGVIRHGDEHPVGSIRHALRVGCLGAGGLRKPRCRRAGTVGNRDSAHTRIVCPCGQRTRQSPGTNPAH